MDVKLQAIQAAVWEGRIPTVVTLAADELTTLERPRELFLMLPRQGYLPYAATREVYDHFGVHAPPCPDEVWFECDGTPLRWTVPIGVLFDLHCLASAPPGAVAASAVDDSSEHPWRLVAHFSNFPGGIVLRGGGVRDPAAAASAHYLNSLKESTYLRCGSTQPIMSLSTEAQRQLQRAVEAGDFVGFATVQAELLPPSAASDERRRKARVAVRVHCGAGPWLQPSLSVLRDDLQPRTLAEVLGAALPAEFGGGADARGAPAAAVVHGLPALLGAPIDWLSACCAHPDGFLHVVVARPRAASGLRGCSGAES